MTLTTAQARQVVFDHLDDDQTRWTEAQIDVALTTALSLCLNDYVTNGGDRFEIEVTGTSTSAGVIDLSAQKPIKINGVSVLESTRYFPISRVKLEERIIHDTQGRSVQVRLTPTIPFSATDDDPLVDGNTWDAFDQWVCARAAMFAAVKDDDLLKALSRMEAMMQNSVLTTAKIPGARRMPKRSQWIGSTLGWAWKAGDYEIQMCRRLGF